MKRVLFSLIAVLVLLLAGACAWLFFTPWGAKTVVRELARLSLGARTVSWQALSGSLIGGVKVDQLEVRVIPFLPESSFLRVQVLSIRCARLSLDGLDVEVTNARLFHPGDDPIVLNVSLSGRSVSGNVYTSGLDLSSVRDVLTKFLEVPPFKGSLRDIDLFISGRLDRPVVTGKFFVERITQNDFILQDVPSRADLHFARGNVRWETYGKLFLDGGSLRSSFVRIDLDPSVLTFTGRPSRPELDIHAVSKVARTKINISVRGTRQDPVVALSSDPSYPKEQLLLMLATGKSWNAVVEGQMDRARTSPALTANFVDYLLFGGDRLKFIRAIGLSDISFSADERKQGVTFSKELTQRLGVGYGVEVGTGPQSQRGLTQRLEGEYQLTDHFLFGAQKEMKSVREAGASATVNPPASGAGIPLSSDDIPDDRVFLKYRASF
ncbi:MAG: translocation/assembly module TamB domain-containing protein [Candidatus Omnitrophota bacterium]